MLHIAQVQIDHFLERRPVLSAHLPQPRQSGGAHSAACAAARKSNSYGVQGRGPTRLISPRNTLINCGNSSDPIARKTSPPGMSRESPPQSSLRVGPLAVTNSFKCTWWADVSAVDLHCPELQAHEPPAIMPNPLLPEKGRSRRNNLDEDCDDHPHRYQNRKGQQHARDVQHPFPCGDPARHVLRLRVARRR